MDQILNRNIDPLDKTLTSSATVTFNKNIYFYIWTLILIWLSIYYLQSKAKTSYTDTKSKDGRGIDKKNQFNQWTISTQTLLQTSSNTKGCKFVGVQRKCFFK